MTGWGHAKRKRWNTDERIRVERRFRHHIYTPSNPWGRIVRPLCSFCKRGEQKTGTEAHHIDYKRPFVVVWCCQEHHRLIELKQIKVTVRKIFDYTSLIEPIMKKGLHIERRGMKIVNEPVDKAATPF